MPLTGLWSFRENKSRQIWVKLFLHYQTLHIIALKLPATHCLLPLLLQDPVDGLPDADGLVPLLEDKNMSKLSKHEVCSKVFSFFHTVLLSESMVTIGHKLSASLTSSLEESAWACFWPGEVEVLGQDGPILVLLGWK